ncbi:hypothetical protein [Streptacidiphilus cavernicola]|uniref:Uncharacterized protein n=1 Tax=Streptacidiphilus cavernicola TaxID=3342716 RepID=A0ABV6VPY9_9ACTN
MIALALADPPRRRTALTDAAVAMAFATAGALAARQTPQPPVTPADRRRLIPLRDRWAHSLARFVVPDVLRPVD